jgi:DNA invertase Pin-like site-specific DNA recombinase
MRVIAYLRVSTDRQAEHGLGLDVQRRAVRSWASANGHKVIATYQDAGISGGNGLDNRPGLAAAFGDLEDDKADALVVYRLDRLARKLASQETWIEQLGRRGKAVISVTEPDVGADEMRDLVRQILGAIAQYERAVIRRRMQSGRAEKAAQGGYAYGSPAYGFRSEDRQLVPDAHEAAVVARILAMHAHGMGTRGIAAALNADGVPTKRGNAWFSESVARVIRRATRDAS